MTAPSYVKFNNFWDNLAPRLGLTWISLARAKASCLLTMPRLLKLQSRWM
jgi:hypothetical protein